MYSIVQNCSIGALSIHFLEYMYSYSQIVQSGHFLYIFWSTCIRTPKLFNRGTFYTFFTPKLFNRGTFYTFFKVHVLNSPNLFNRGTFYTFFGVHVLNSPKLFNRGTFYTFFGVHVFVLPNCSIGALSIHFLEYMYSIVQNCSIGALSIHFLKYMYSYSQIVQSGHFLYIFSSTRTHSPKLFNWGTLNTFYPPSTSTKILLFRLQVIVLISCMTIRPGF
jgi:hypothetical protein